MCMFLLECVVCHCMCTYVESNPYRNIFYWELLTLSWDPFSGTGPVQASDPHMGPHAG